MMVRFATLCDTCKARSEEYSSWPSCQECQLDVCPKCYVSGSWTEDERHEALCLHCSVEVTKMFWDMFEDELIVSVREASVDYMLREGESAESYAHRTREKMETAGMRSCNHTSRVFRRLAKRLGIKPTLQALVQAEKESL